MAPIDSATAANTFNPGRIIDNNIFTNASSMSVNDIQSFLNNKLGTCDTNGTTPKSYYLNNSTGEVHSYSFNGGSLINGSYSSYGQAYANYWNNNTRDSLGNNRSSNYISNESVAPYVCINSYIENPNNGANNLQKPNSTISGGQTAAQIIFNAAQTYQINPQVLIVTLQKEQGLITDNWPWMNEYSEAMGYNCPDTSACSGYASFNQQVSAAASQYRNYLSNPLNFNYQANSNNTVLYSPRSGCGSSVVYIQNSATAALYDYTPYQPDATVLANTNAPGSSNGAGSAPSDSCATYGNRNFWWYFNSWFGLSINSNLPPCNQNGNSSLTCIWQLTNPATNSQYLTGNMSIRDSLYINQNYNYNGVKFYGSTVQTQGTIPVYELNAPSGGSFITTDQNEYNDLANAGWTSLGISFYANPSNSKNSGPLVTRLYNQVLGQHFWTSDQNEVASLISNGWTNEGMVFGGIDATNPAPPAPSGLLNVYRFYINASHSHFWTTDLNERDSLIQSGYSYEGVAWYSSQNTSLLPLYRLYSPRLKEHLYTLDSNEKNVLSSSGNWNYEGVSQYVTTSPNNNPVYRLYNSSLDVHLWTLDSNEKNVLTTSQGWKYEGVAWYIPNN